MAHPGSILAASAGLSQAGFGEWIGAWLLWLLPWFLPLLLFVAGLYYTLSLPLRRQERARFLLDVIEAALQQGQSIERRMVALSRTGDPSLATRFHLLAAYLEQGHPLLAGLERVPRLIPLQMLAMLKVGEAVGDWRKVLPACRQLLHDGKSQTMALVNYQVALAFVLNPLFLIIPPFVSERVVPVFSEILKGFGSATPTPWTAHFIHHAPLLAFFQLLRVVALYLGALIFLGGPHFFAWLEAGLPRASDWLFFRIPWRRKRWQRDLSMMLSLLLDAGVPEARAIELAAQSTDNQVMRRRAQQAIRQLRRGVPLTEAVRVFDESGEFLWRVKNGAGGASGFLRALEGWHESLEARAFRQEQTAAQVITTTLTLLNGATVALVALAVLQAIQFINTWPLK